MSIDQNKETVRKYIEEVLSNFDYTHFDECLHEDFAAYPGGDKLDKAGHQAYFGKMRENAPDMRNKLKEMIAEGDKVVAMSEWTGNENARPEGAPEGGMKVMAVYTLKDGKIIHGEVYHTR